MKSDIISKNNMSQALSKIKKCIAAVLVLLLVMGSSGLASAAYDYQPVVKTDTIDYYHGYGEPELVASLAGNSEFRKGDNATLSISLGNIGTIEKLVVNQSVGKISDKLNYQMATIDGSADKVVVVTAENLQQYQAEMTNLNALIDLSMKEMQCEAARADATSVYVTLVSPTELIEVPADSELSYVDEISSGDVKTVSFPINLDKNIPAGDYELSLLIDYKFSNNVLMYKAKNNTELLTTFLASSDHTVEYADRSIVLPVTIHVEPSPIFEVTKVEGNLVSGKTSTIYVTYTNTGDGVAYDAEAKISLMNPLTSDSVKAFLGNVSSGDSVTVSYDISSNKSTSIEKVYGISSDVRYYDDEEDLWISPSMRIDVNMELGVDYFTPKNVLLVLGVFCVLYVAVMLIKGAISKKKGKKNEPQRFIPSLIRF